jgi:hypothetical protein
MQYIPPAPAPPKKRHIARWVIGGFVALVVLGALAELGDKPATVTPDISSVEGSDIAIDDETLSDDTVMAIVRLTWENEMTEGQRTSICDYYNTPPVGTTPEMVRVFARGAELSYADAERVLDQLLAEKC